MGFKDVQPIDWFYNCVNRIAARKVIAGYADGTFRPNQNITRAEVAACIDNEYEARFSAIDALKDHVVKINAGAGLGTGIIMDRKHIATNVHVVLGALSDDGYRIEMDKIKITFHNGETVRPLGIPWGDGRVDCAIIAMPEASCPNYVSCVDISPGDARPGEEVYAIGFPGGFEYSVSMGIVCHPNRVFESNTPGYEGNISYIETDARINPGNSGGPLFDRYGRCIGMNSFKILSVGSKQTPVEAMGFALHAKEIMEVFAEAKRNEQSKVVDVAQLKLGLSRYLSDRCYVE